VSPSQESVAALSVHHLSKRFGDRVAFDDVSFDVGHGDVFGFLGPNGAGKTTMVRTLGTLLAPSTGSAHIAGIPLSPERGVEIRQRISIMPETPGLYLRLTVDENLECFAGLYALPDAAQRIRRALRAVNLAGRANDLCGALSKGLRQRVSLARALLGNPEVLRSSTANACERSSFPQAPVPTSSPMGISKESTNRHLRSSASMESWRALA
jgi:ABC-2 type transport system ATP-binding protein